MGVVPVNGARPTGPPASTRAGPGQPGRVSRRPIAARDLQTGTIGEMDESVLSFGAEMVNGGRDVAAPVEEERFVAYAVDIASRFALSMVIDRSERPWARWLQCWRREGAAWVLASSSPEPVGSGVLGARVGVGEPSLVRVGSGALLLRSGRWPWSGEYGCWKDFQASGDVATVVIDDRRCAMSRCPGTGG